MDNFYLNVAINSRRVLCHRVCSEHFVRYFWKVIEILPIEIGHHILVTDVVFFTSFIIANGTICPPKKASYHLKVSLVESFLAFLLMI